MIRTLDENKVIYHLVSIRGSNHSDYMFRSLMLGDYISMYMAEIQGIDSSDVPPITSLKKKLKPIIDDFVKDLL